MIRLTLRNIRANRARFALTTFAVVLGVSFVVSSFVLTDGLRSTFGDLSNEIVSGTDLELRPDGQFGSSPEVEVATLPDVQAIPGVAAAAPLVEAGDNDIRPINGDGDEISINGPPQLTFSWVDDEQLSPFSLVEGAAPTGTAEFTMDIDAANKHGFVVGSTYEVITPTGVREMMLTGITRFGSDNATVGATLMQMDAHGLLEVTGRTGYDAVQVALQPGADADEVAAAMASVGSNLTVVDNATLASEQQADFDEGINLIGNVMLGFAGVSLFVSLFIIYNTFSIVLGQRTRELALLRTVGADTGQLRRSVLGEALAIGLLASATGIPAGLGVAVGLDALFGAIGADLPDYPTIVSGRTIVVALVVGVGMTLVSAFGPAHRAAKVAPIAALSEIEPQGTGALGRLRTLSGSTLVAIGVTAGALGLFVASETASTVALLALGAMGVFVGVTVLSPAIAAPTTSALRVPFGRLGGVAGRLAADNAARNPRRTATTAAALMIGLALVSMALVVGESVKAQLHATLESSVKADYLVTDEASEAGFPAELTAQLGALPETANVTGFSYDLVELNASFADVVGTDLAELDALFNIDIVSGVAADVAVADPLLISAEVADTNGLAPGDTVTMRFASGADVDLTVIGVYGEEFIFDEGYVLDFSTWDRVAAYDRLDWVALSGTEGVTAAALDAAIDPIRLDYPGAMFETFGQYVDRFEGFIDQALTALNVMVALAVIIALIGIANTLALSVFERTRELGLLRAVGMTRPQLRRMIRLEAGVVALFGATLGITVGVAFGWAAVAALPATITSTLAIPYMRIAILVVVAATAGLLAAWGPARRAGRLNVLDAIGG